MFEDSYQPPSLGRVAYARWRKDPKSFLFTLARYKFVSKLIEGKENVMEVGCGDGFMSPLVSRSVNTLLLTDYDPLFVQDAQANCKSNNQENVECSTFDFSQQPFPSKFDAIYALDVLEHIQPGATEHRFILNISHSLKQGGVCIFGMPTSASQLLIPDAQRDPGHINCKTGNELRQTMLKYFPTVFLFSMNDEVVHTGNSDMAYYIFGVGIHVG